MSEATTPTTIPPRLNDLQAEYDRLAQQCGAFDGVTKLRLKEGDEARKQFIKDRSAERQELLNRKLVAFKALEAAQKQAAIDAEAERVAAEALGLEAGADSAKPNSVATIDSQIGRTIASGQVILDDGSPPEAAFKDITDEVIGELVDRHKDQIKALLPDAAAPANRAEAIALLVAAGITPELGVRVNLGGAQDADDEEDEDIQEDGGKGAGGTSVEKPLTAKLYASVSGADVDELLAANAETIEKLPGYAVPKNRKEKLDLLVTAGIRPVKKAK